VESIGVMAFGECGSLSTVICYATTPPELTTQSYEEDGETYTITPFTGAGSKDGMVLYVPANSVQAYTNAGWNTYFTQILPIGGEGYVFTAKTPENVMLTFVVLGTENNTTYVQVGTGDTNKNCVVSTPKNWDGTLTIPATVTDAGGNTYNVAGIADNALKCWDDLKSLTVEEGISYIGTGTAQYYWYGAFYACYYLTTVSLPSTINKIDNFAFNYCNSLSEVYLYNTGDPIVPSLGNNAFTCSSSSAVLYVDDNSVGTYQESPWSSYFTIMGMSQKPFIALTPEGVALKYYFTYGPDNEPWVMLGSGQSSSVVSTPANWDGSLTIPAKVTNGSGNEYNVIGICDRALWELSGLRSLTISEGIPYVGSYSGNAAVAYNENLETIYLPSSTVALSQYAFTGNSNLKDVYLYATAVPEIGYSAFNDWVNATLHVPAGTKALYDESDWAQYFGNGDRIVEMEGGEVEEGDINGDSEVNSGDVMAIYSVMAGNGTPEMQARADVNGDGNVDSGDIMAIYNIMAGHAGH
jgi:hypothetical protein